MKHGQTLYNLGPVSAVLDQPEARQAIVEYGACTRG